MESGWQLAGYEGKGSYKYLMDTYNMTSNDAGIQSAPLSFLRGGYFYWSSGNLLDRGSYGYYWESKIHSVTNARNLYFYSTALGSQDTYAKGRGFSIRCVVKA